MPSDDPFALLLVRLRKAAGLTQDLQADAINRVSGRATMTRREISRYENGENVPTNYTIEHIAVVCGVPPAPLAKEAAAARARRRKRRKDAEEDPNDVNRRRMLEGVVAGATAAAVEPWSRLHQAISRGRRLDDESVAALVDRAEYLHISEHSLTAHQLRGLVESHLDAITDALPHAGHHERDLLIAAGETAALAGWVAWDMGDHTAARNYYRVTNECATTSGHTPLRALALAYASYGSSTPVKAAALLRQAALDVRGHGHATAAAWIHGRHAEECANAKGSDDALRSLERARLLYDFADHTAEQSWVRFMTPGRMDSLVLSVLGQLSHQEIHETAKDAVKRLGDDLPDSGVVVLGDLAAALLKGGDLEQGVDVAHRFAAAAEARPNTMGRARAGLIASRLPDREKELARHLQQLTA
ncbi:helix-turn-helix domain-containing protein [Streptomyces exfoliatus]|uniref:helix-turn-helix domain-containing protein n=1 Tax=Streptomyces exfoliatus TaxID=1905 RepID=UPI0004671183|nr:helix-turn-helix transcriptional regulator [Streptomyces exfoliatus]